MDIEGISQLIVVWMLHRSDEAELCAKVPSDDPPHGVLATRAPPRPYPIARSTARPCTPILDIKPYLSSVPEEKLRRGLARRGGGAKTKQIKLFINHDNPR